MCDVARCKPVEFEKNAIDRLVLNKEKKGVIEALVHRHPGEDPSHSTDIQDETSPHRRAEFTSQQSAGRIVLLHGPPGTGKSYVSAPFRMRACAVLI